MTTFRQLIEQAEYNTFAYCGRGMYGKNCLAICTDSSKTVGDFFADVLQQIQSILELSEYSTNSESEQLDKVFELMTWLGKAMRSHKTDHLGMNFVVYFRDIPFE